MLVLVHGLLSNSESTDYVANAIDQSPETLNGLFIIHIFPAVAGTIAIIVTTLISTIVTFMKEYFRIKTKTKLSYEHGLDW